MTDWVQIIRDLGFPVAVAGYVLIRLDRQLLALRNAVDRLTLEIRAQRQGGYGPPTPSDAL
ncbi:MAG: YvrJ family protein [Egibacteraceae bacterium]